MNKIELLIIDIGFQWSTYSSSSTSSTKSSSPYSCLITLLPFDVMSAFIFIMLISILILILILIIIIIFLSIILFIILLKVLLIIIFIIMYGISSCLSFLFLPVAPRGDMERLLPIAALKRASSLQRPKRYQAMQEPTWMSKEASKRLVVSRWVITQYTPTIY